MALQNLEDRCRSATNQFMKVVDYEMRKKLGMKGAADGDSGKEMVIVHEEEVVMPNSSDRFVLEFEMSTNLPLKVSDVLAEQELELCPECCHEPGCQSLTAVQEMCGNLKIPENIVSKG
jgi:hypothetical protein